VNAEIIHCGGQVGLWFRIVETGEGLCSLCLCPFLLWSSEALPKVWTYFRHAENKLAGLVVIEMQQSVQITQLYHLSLLFSRSQKVSAWKQWWCRRSAY